LTLVDGARELARAFEAGVEIVEVFAVDGDRDHRVAALVADLRQAGIPIVEVRESVMARLAFGDRTGGIVGCVRVPSTGLDRLTIGSEPLVVVVEAVEKPGNLGAILRSADAVGVDAVIVADPTTDLFNPNVIRSSVGTVFAVPIAVSDGAAARSWLAEHGIRVFAARVDAPLPYTAADLRGPIAIVLGAETTGLSHAWTGPGIEPVSVPMRGVADSLNVSVTAAILLYEARRQRDSASGSGR
jgi:TrmH family RNA methyltransferase